jgi:cytochrome c oxidase subunit 4
MTLTIITVAISYLHLSVKAAITVALVVATVKASLVASYFMHLISERKVIYWTLILTAVFFILLMFLPISTDQDSTRLLH